MPIPTVKPAVQNSPIKRFTVQPWNIVEGERTIVYGDTGIGKTSLCALAPKPVFLGLDEGGSKYRHPVTDEPLKRVPNLSTFEDVRAALQQVNLYDDYETVIIDTITILEDWAESYVVANIPTDKGAKVKNILGYGYNKGYKHLYNTMKLILQDCDDLIRRNKNVILIAQAALHNVPNPSGEDFYRAGLRLHVDKTWNIESLYCEWADDIFRIDYHEAFVKEKKVTGSTQRAVFIQPELYFRAKTRTPLYDEDGNLLSVVSFADQTDNSIWQFVFGDK